MSIFNKKNTLVFILLSIVGVCFASESVTTSQLNEIIQVQEYFRAIHIMAMLLVGFGFLMFFVRKYGRTTATATYLLVSITIPTYFLLNYLGLYGDGNTQIETLILSEFAAASLLISAGSVLGRLKLYQYLLLGILFVPIYAFNEWLMLDGGFGIIPQGSLVDTGGSIVIHGFGAIFGLGLIFSLTSQKEYSTKIEEDSVSNRFSLLGSMVLWIFWPSFCAALVAPKDIILTVVNVIMALSGSTLATYFASIAIRKKVSTTDIANATLAGGVAIGSTCDATIAPISFVIGALAGILSTFGFAVLQEKIQRLIKKIDTCGVLYLHGLPGIFGGIVAIFVVKGINVKSQLIGIFLSMIIAIISGLIVGKIISFTGKRKIPYIDDEEIITD